MKRVWPMRIPSAASRAATTSDRSLICSGPITLGSIRADTSGMMAAAISGTANSSGRLMRTQISCPCAAMVFAAPGSAARAASFSLGGMESSRSRMITSAPRVCALATKRSATAGMNSKDRQLFGLDAGIRRTPLPAWRRDNHPYPPPSIPSCHPPAPRRKA